MSWERRWHPLLQEWVTITSHRNTRPWSGDMPGATSAMTVTYEPDCYLCPGNQRISGVTNDPYETIFVFDNDHPSFGPDAPTTLEPAPGIYQNAPATGICRVVCYSPNHSGSLAALSAAETADVVRCWGEQTRELAARPDVDYVLVFENKGGVVGVSNPHPHCQIYATGFVFKAIETEVAAIRAYRQDHGESLFAKIIETEANDGRRVIAENEHAIAFVPYFARFPYEVYVAPRAEYRFLHELPAEILSGFSAVLSEALARLDNLWQAPFPYMLLAHQAPCDGGDYRDYHCHIQIHPPMRQPGLQKYLASVETGAGNYLNDASPEQKAAELRAVPAAHYLGQA